MAAGLARHGASAMTPRPPWPRKLEWRAVRDRVRLVLVIHMDSGAQESTALDLSPLQAEQLLDEREALETAIAYARGHGRPANAP